MKSAETPSEYTECSCLHDSTVVTTHVTLTDNGEAKRRVLTNLFKQSQHWRLASYGK